MTLLRKGGGLIPLRMKGMQRGIHMLPNYGEGKRKVRPLAEEKEKGGEKAILRTPQPVEGGKKVPKLSN